MYVQDSSERAKEADATVLGASTGSNSSSVVAAIGVHAAAGANRPVPPGLSKQTDAPSKTVTSEVDSNSSCKTAFE